MLISALLAIAFVSSRILGKWYTVYAGIIIISLRKFPLAEQVWQIHRKKEHVARMNAQRVRSKKI